MAQEPCPSCPVCDLPPPCPTCPACSLSNLPIERVREIFSSDALAIIDCQKKGDTESVVKCINMSLGPCGSQGYDSAPNCQSCGVDTAKCTARVNLYDALREQNLIPSLWKSNQKSSCPKTRDTGLEEISMTYGDDSVSIIDCYRRNCSDPQAVSSCITDRLGVESGYLQKPTCNTPKCESVQLIMNSLREKNLIPSLWN